MFYRKRLQGFHKGIWMFTCRGFTLGYDYIGLTTLIRHLQTFQPTNKCPCKGLAITALAVGKRELS